MSDTGVPLSVAGVPVRELLRQRRHALVEAILEQIAGQVALYGELPEEVLDVDVRGIVHSNLAAFERGLVEPEGLSADDLEDLRRSAYRRAEEGLPQELVLSAYMVGAMTGWAAVTGDAEPEDAETLSILGLRLLTHLHQVQKEVSRAFIQELRMSYGYEHTLRDVLLSALLHGRVGRSDDSEIVGMTLAPTYTVLSLSTEVRDCPPRRPGDNQLRSYVEARRRLRGIREALDSVRHRPEPLMRLDAGGGLVLLPESVEVDDPELLERAARVVTAISERAGVDVRAAVVSAPAHDVPAAARLAGELRDLVQAGGRPPGLYTLDDLLFEYQFTRATPASEALRRRLDPLDERPDLVETLRTYLETNLSRRATSDLLALHPNTVDYRLGRIRDLIGLDPTQAADLTLLRGWLVMRSA